MMMESVHVRVWRRLAAVLVSLVLPYTSASAFVDPPTFSPEQPYAEQPITMSVRAGQCHGFAVPTEGSPPFVEVQRDGGIIDVIILGTEATDPLLCMLPTWTEIVNIGGFPEGNYTVRIRIRNVSHPSYPVLPPTSQASLTVRAQHPVAIPASGLIPLFLFAVIILGTIAIRSRKSITTFLGFLLIAPMAFPTSSHAQSEEDGTLVIFELVRSEHGPDPYGVVSGFDPSGGLPPPLEALSVENPEGIQYFIPYPFRAQGDFKAYLDANPELPRARLEQMIIVRYPSGSNTEAAVAALIADKYIRHAKIPIEMDLSLPPGSSGKALPGIQGSATQYWINAMQFSTAWSRAGGWARIGVLDNGLHTSHPDLRSLSGTGALTGGNFLSYAAIDIGRHGFSNPIDFNVDEMEPVPIASPSPVCADGNGLMVATYAGHGTHVHGLIAASHTNADGVVGACKNCGLASIRTLREVCYSSGAVFPTMNQVAPWVGLSILSDTGTQIVNMSFGGQGNGTINYPDNFCSDPAYFNEPECIAVAHAKSQGVMMVAASGNNRGGFNTDSQHRSCEMAQAT